MIELRIQIEFIAAVKKIQQCGITCLQ